MRLQCGFGQWQRRGLSLVIAMCFIGTCALGAHAQGVSQLVERMVERLKANPQEKVHLHTDRNKFVAGETVWFKGYVTDALTLQPVTGSNFLYVELVNDSGVVESRVKVMRENENFAGHVDLPHHLRSGKYVLNAYTRHMEPLKGFNAIKPITVINGRLSEIKKNKIKARMVGDGNVQPHCIALREKGRRLLVGTQGIEQGLPCTLLAVNRGFPIFSQEFTTGKVLEVNLDSIPGGVTALFLLNRQLQMLDRVDFYSSGMEAEVSFVDIVPSLLRHDAGKEVQLHLHAPALYQGETVSMSVSVVSKKAVVDNLNVSIAGDLMLSQDVAGGIDNADLMMASDRVLVLPDVHNCRYGLNDALNAHSTPASVSVPFESMQSIDGKVTSLIFGKPIADCQVSAISPQMGECAVAVSDADGCFSLDNLHILQGAEYVVQARTKKGGDKVNLTLDEHEFPEFDSSYLHFFHQSPREIDYTMEEVFVPNSLLLGEVEVRATKRHAISGGSEFSRLADFSMSREEMNKIDATCMHELLRRIPGIHIMGERCYVRASNSIYGDNPAAIAVDGVIMDGNFDLHLINMSDVAHVDVFKTGNTVIWGHLGTSGVINIVIKDGSYTENADNRTYVKKIAPLGCQLPRLFNEFDDNSLTVNTGYTVYWNPEVSIDSNAPEANICFPAKCEAGDYLITVEGVTSQGRLVSATKTITIGD